MALKNQIVFVSNNCHTTGALMKEYGMTVTYDYTSDGISLACFTGGADICPILYGEKVHTTTSFSVTRDLEEIKAWKHFAFEKYNLPKIGICRGMQLGNVLLGGGLIQDVDNHQGVKDHKVKLISTKGDRFAHVNSCHHQMVLPASDMRILAYADEARTMKSPNTTRKVSAGSWADVEAIFHPYTNFLGVQWHPEWTHKGAREVFEELVYEHLDI